MKTDISIIIPTFNVESYIKEGLESILQQTFKGSVETLIIDDCSTDNTLQIVKGFQKEHPNFNLKIYVQPQNMRQGTARNRGIKESSGTYLFFLDGDDLLEQTALERMFYKGNETNADFVLCNWGYYYGEKGLGYINQEHFMKQQILLETDCEKLLEAHTYFTVNKLYRKEFLTSNNIQYGEGYIYEDFEFYAEVAQYASKIAIIPEMLYKVRVNDQSTTQTNHNTTLHIDSLVKAVTSLMKKFNPRNDYSYFYLYKYVMTKTLNYARVRAPIEKREVVIKNIVKMLNMKNKHYPIPNNMSLVDNLLFKKRFVQNERIKSILLLDTITKNFVARKLLNTASNLKERFKKNRLIIKFYNRVNNKKIENQFKKKSVLPIEQNLILFLGFDFRYVGNSKYFYEYLQSQSDLNYKILYVSDDSSIPNEHRVSPYSEDFYRYFSTANIIVAESWIPSFFPKRENQKWLQLWHGTPFKKMLFDTKESRFALREKRHKKQKKRDISNWDLLIADSEIGEKKLASSFAFDQNKILTVGYPRVQWLKQNRNNQDLKTQIKQTLKIDAQKKILLYVPTWRDYNYINGEADYSYQLDLGQLSQRLGEEYIIISKGHSLEKNPISSKGIVEVSSEVDVQQLILISDILISDYSSIIFDGLAIDKPFYLYVNDFEKYNAYRGVHIDMYDNLKKLSTDNIDELKEMIENSHFENEDFQRIKKQYSNIQKKNSNQQLYTCLKKWFE